MIEELPRVSLCNLPTPLNEASRLSTRLGGPRILIKRDDLTGLAMGGNKCRMLEFLMAQAKDMSADVVIAGGEPQSNLACQVTAAARKLGMEPVLFFFKGIHSELQGNFLLDRILKADIRITGLGFDDLYRVSERMVELANELRSKGRTPYLLNFKAWTPLATVGYMLAAVEIHKQLRERGLTAQYLFLSSGSGCTQAGLILGAKYCEAPFKIVGINPSGRSLKAEKTRKIAELANGAAKLLGIDHSFKPNEIIVRDEYIGDGPAPTKESIEAIKLVAQTEGIFLDPTYTGKAMAALIDYIRQGKIKSGQTVIFYHSGGLPAIFAYSRELSSD